MTRRPASGFSAVWPPQASYTTESARDAADAGVYCPPEPIGANAVGERWGGSGMPRPGAFAPCRANLWLDSAYYNANTYLWGTRWPAFGAKSSVLHQAGKGFTIGNCRFVVGNGSLPYVRVCIYPPVLPPYPRYSAPNTVCHGGIYGGYISQKRAIKTEVINSMQMYKGMQVRHLRRQEACWTKTGRCR